MLPDRDETRLWILPDLGEALADLGEFESARAVIEESMRAAIEASDDVLAAHASLTRLLVDFYEGGGDGWSAHAMEAAADAERVLSGSSHEAGKALLWRLRYYVASAGGQFGRAAEAAEQIIEHARRAGNSRLTMRGSVD